MKKRMIAACCGILFVLALGTIARAQGAKVNGAWVMSYMGRGGTVMATVTLMQDGGSLKGSMKVGDGMDVPLDGGTVSGNDIMFSVTRAGRDGNPQKTEYKGTVAGDMMTGTFMRGPAPVDWTAKRQ